MEIEVLRDVRLGQCLVVVERRIDAGLLELGHPRRHVAQQKSQLRASRLKRVDLHSHLRLRKRLRRPQPL